MTLADVTFPVEYGWGRQHVLVFSAGLAVRLAEIQAEHGDPRHVPAPIKLTNGRWMLSADILTECLPGGLVYGGFSQLDAGRFDEIAVVALADVLAMLPPDPTEA
jgi:hypothetical protein